MQTSNRSRVAGIRAATAPIVALAEDHSFPDPDWADALITAHQARFAVVGPVLRNANPRSMLSWANLLLEYAPWLEGTPGQEMKDLPGHNSAYRRDLLLAFGEEIHVVEEGVGHDPPLVEPFDVFIVQASPLHAREQVLDVFADLDAGPPQRTMKTHTLSEP